MNPDLHKQLVWLWSLTRKYRLGIFSYMALEGISVASGLMTVYWLKQAIDIATHAVSGDLRNALWAVIMSLLLTSVTSIIAQWMGESVKIRMTVWLQNSLIYIQMMAAWPAIKRWHTGDLQVRMNNDVAEVIQLLSNTAPSFCVNSVKMLSALGFLFLMDPMLAGMILVASPLFLFSKLYYKKLRKVSREVKQAESEAGTIMQENLKNRFMIRALLLSHARWVKMEQAQTFVRHLKNRQLALSAFTQGAMRFSFNGGYLLAFSWGVYGLQANEITYGTLAAFLQLVARVQMPVVAMLSFFPAVIRCRAAVERLMELDEVETEDCSGSRVLTAPVCLHLNNVSFGYDDQEIIKHLQAVIQAGKPVAVTGATGRGKTTLIRLILGLVVPSEGTLFLQTANDNYLLGAETRVNFSYVPQGNTLFAGTIRENLLLSNPEASEEDLKEALTVACAGFVFTFPLGLDTPVGEHGQRLSEGQAQRLAVARALLHRGIVWLFDEVTSALDADTARQLVQNLLIAGKDKIIVFVTHDKELMKACAQVICLD